MNLEDSIYLAVRELKPNYLKTLIQDSAFTPSSIPFEALTYLVDVWKDKKISTSKFKEILLICLKAGVPVDKLLYGRTTILHHASGHDEEGGIIKTLLKFKADIDKTDDWGSTPMLYAIHTGNKKGVKLLLKCDITIKNSMNLNPLDLCHRLLTKKMERRKQIECYVDCFTLLVQNFPEALVQTPKGTSTMYEAALSLGLLECI